MCEKKKNEQRKQKYSYLFPGISKFLLTLLQAPHQEGHCVSLGEGTFGWSHLAQGDYNWYHEVSSPRKRL